MRRVVVTGMGLVTPLGIGLSHVWNRLIEGESGVRAIQSFDVSDLPSRIAGQVPRGDRESGLFNADDWVPPKDQRRMDEFIVYALAAAVQAVEDSGWQPDSEEERERTGVMIGSGIGGLPGITEGAIMLHERGPRRISPYFIPASLINLASGHVSIRYGFKGPNHAVVTACSTGAHALGDAARCQPGSMMTRRAPRGRGIGTATGLSWEREPAFSCSRSMSTRAIATPGYMPRCSDTACRATRTI
jgi:3-oxoacyl-[acyl-carrier-protein] synthase II